MCKLFSIGFLFVTNLPGAVVLNATHDAFVTEASPTEGSNNELLLVKDEIGGGLANRKSWIVFDVTDPTIDLTQDAIFTLTLGEVTALGRPVSNPNLTIGIYALNAGFVPQAGELGTNWTEAALTWNNAPGNSSDDQSPDLADTTFLGTTFVAATPVADPAGTEYQFTVSNPAAYLQTDSTLTFILTSQTSSDSNARFASSENPDFAGPRLTLQTVPEPSTSFILFASSLLILARRRA